MKDYEQQDCQLFNTGRFNDIVYANQKLILLKVTSDVVHYIEDIGMLRLDIHVDFLTAFLELLLQIHQLNLAAADFRNQNHIKVAIQDVLIDRQNVDIVLGENLANHGDNAYTVLTDDRDNGCILIGFHNITLPELIIRVIIAYFQQAD